MIEKDLASLQHPNLAAVIGVARQVDTSSKVVFLHDGSKHPYDKLCICTGALPKVTCLTSHSKSVEHSAPRMHGLSSSKLSTLRAGGRRRRACARAQRQGHRGQPGAAHAPCEAHRSCRQWRHCHGTSLLAPWRGGTLLLHFHSGMNQALLDLLSSTQRCYGGEHLTGCLHAVAEHPLLAKSAVVR